MSNDTTTHGQLIRDQVANVLVRPLEASSVVLGAGPQIFNSSEPIRVPRLVSSTGVGFVGEGEQIPDNYTVDFGELRLMPSGRKSLKSITRVTNELIRQSAVGITQVLQARLVEDVRTKLDDALLNGDGVDDTITGIFNQPGTQTGVLDLADPDSLLDALALATAAEVTPNRWFINAGDFYTLRKVKDGNGRYLIQETLQEGVSYTLFGVPVTVSNKVTKGKAALVNMNEVAVVRDLDPSITILTEKYADTDETGIRVVSRYDLGLIRPEGVIILEEA